MSYSKKQIALITGASSGLGLLFASELAKNHLHLSPKIDEIWVVARRTDRLLDLQKQLLPFAVRVFSGDLTQEDFLEQLDREFANVDIRWLINNAGFGLVGEFSSLDRKRQLEMIDLNIRALTDLTFRALPHMREGSRIVQVASSAGFFPLPNFAVYAATKAYVVSFSNALTAELLDRKISVTAVCPGPIATEFFNVAAPGAKKPLVAMADPLDVVRLAIVDAQKSSLISAYGILYKLAILFSGLTPRWLLKTSLSKLFKKPLNL